MFSRQMWIVKQRPVIFQKLQQGNAYHGTIAGNWQRQHFNADVQQEAEADMYCMFWIQYINYKWC